MDTPGGPSLRHGCVRVHDSAPVQEHGSAPRDVPRNCPGGQDLGPAGEADAQRRATILGSVTVPGSPEHVSSARAFITRSLSRLPRIDSDAATLLTSELVTNAIQHTRSGADGGTVTVVVIVIRDGVLVEVIDDGAAGTPIVKGDLYAADGHGLYLVQQFAAQWGYLRDASGTTVWFHLPAAGGQPEPQPADCGGQALAAVMS
jgi:anti-sigma regulatory factor (Ser/Thr protein kinase)